MLCVPVAMGLLTLALTVAGRAALPDTQEGYVTTPDGVRLFYAKIGRASPVAVLLHGGHLRQFRV